MVTMFNAKRVAVVVGICLALAACGGGGDGEPSAVGGGALAPFAINAAASPAWPRT